MNRDTKRIHAQTLPIGHIPVITFFIVFNLILFASWSANEASRVRGEDPRHQHDDRQQGWRHAGWLSLFFLLYSFFLLRVLVLLCY